MGYNVIFKVVFAGLFGFESITPVLQGLSTSLCFGTQRPKGGPVCEEEHATPTTTTPPETGAAEKWPLGSH